MKIAPPFGASDSVILTNHDSVHPGQCTLLCRLILSTLFYCVHPILSAFGRSTEVQHRLGHQSLSHHTFEARPVLYPSPSGMYFFRHQ